MGKLHEILAVEGNLKGQTEKLINDAKTTFDGRNAAYTGFSKVYTANDAADPYQHPPENKVVGYTAISKFKFLSEHMIRLLDCQYQKELANQKAHADIILTKDDGAEADVTLAQNVPVTMLLTLETRLEEFRKLVEGCPTLDPNLSWTWNDNTQCWETSPVTKLSTRKVPKVITKAPATDKHPAQTEMFTEDVPVGTWKEIVKSGALSVKQKAELFTRVDILHRAVKKARMRANEQEAPNDKMASKIFDYLLKFN